MKRAQSPLAYSIPGMPFQDKFILCLLLLMGTSIHSSIALKCLFHDPKYLKPSEEPWEKECLAKGADCLYYKCQDHEGNFIDTMTTKYYQGCTEPFAANVSCKHFEDDCKAHNGTAHCYRCDGFDFCNDGKHPLLLRCYNFDYGMAVALDRDRAMKSGQFNETAKPKKVEYPRVLGKQDLMDLKQLKDADGRPIGLTKCSQSLGMECINIRCKYRGIKSDLQNQWMTVYKGCAQKKDMDNLCEKHHNNCSNRDFYSCPKQCYMCDHDMCNGASSPPLMAVPILSILHAIAIFYACWKQIGHVLF